MQLACGVGTGQLQLQLASRFPVRANKRIQQTFTSNSSSFFSRASAASHQLLLSSYPSVRMLANLSLYVRVACRANRRLSFLLGTKVTSKLAAGPRFFIAKRFSSAMVAAGGVSKLEGGAGGRRVRYMRAATFSHKIICNVKRGCTHMPGRTRRGSLASSLKGTMTREVGECECC